MINGAVIIIITSQCNSSASSSDDCRTASSGCQRSDQANQLGLRVQL